MAKKFQNLTVDYKKLLNFSASDRAAMAKSEYGQSILSSLTPTQYASLFPSYYKERLPDISGFTAASRAGGGLGGTRTGYEPSTAPTTGGSRQTTTTTATAGRATPSYIRRLKEASGGVDISDPKAKAQLSSEKKAVFDLLKKGQISADDPRAAFLKDISEADLKKAGIQATAGKDGKQTYQMTATAASQMTDEELKKKIGSDKFEGGFAAKSAKLTSDLMKDLGLTREQAAGLVGNLAHESAGLNINIEEKVANKHGTKGYGLAQWTDNPPGKGRRTQLANFAANSGLEINSYEAQYKFLLQELQTTESRALRLIKSAKTPEEAAAAAVAFERPQGYSSKNPDYVDAAKKSLGWKDRLRYTNKSYEIAGDAANAGLPANATPQQVAEYRQKLVEQEENKRAEELAASSLGKLPAGVDTKFAQEYEKMTPGQKQATLTAIERTGVDKFNSIYKENPQQTIQTAAAGAPGAVKLFRTASGSGSDSSRGLRDFGDSQYGAESLSQLTQVGSKVGRTHEITGGGDKGQGSLKGLCGRGSRGVVGALLNDRYFANGIGGNADSLSKGNPYLQNSGMFKAPSSLDKNQMSKEYLDSLPIGTVISSTGGGRGQGHVQVKGPGGTWVSDGIQTKVLTSGYGNFTAHLPNENAIKRMNPKLLGADPATFAYAQSQGYIIPTPSPEQVAQGVPGAPPPSKEEAKENQAKIADATVKKESVDKEELAKAEDLQQEAQATVSQQPREQPGDIPPKESSTTTPIAQQQMAQSTNEVIPVLADGGAKELNTEEITAYPIGPLKGDNSVVVDDNKKPLFTMNTDKESAHYDPVDKTVSVRPLDEKKNKLDKKPMVGKAIPVLAEGGEVDLQASAQGEPVPKVDSEGLQNTETNNVAEPEAASNVGAMAQNAAMGPAPATTASIAENLRNMSANPITCPSFGRAIAASNFKKSGDHYDGGATNVK